ncbi:MAG UNVERIFIED_CONTAM: hypothetical protein LVR18_18840 [Planctomycetaceae bacterium]
MQTLPPIMKVAVFEDQHSERLGHLALSQTVSSRRSEMMPLVQAMPGCGRGRLSHRGRRRTAVALSVVVLVAVFVATEADCAAIESSGDVTVRIGK